MTSLEYLAWFGLLVTAEFCADGIRKLIKTYQKRHIERMKCEVCNQPRRTKKTKDGKHLVCRKCFKLYNESLKDEAKQASL